MKVELLVNLKVASGKIISAGTIFTDPIPEFIMKRVRRGMAKIIDQRPAPERAEPVIETPVIETPVVEEPKEETPEEVNAESSEKPAEPSVAEPAEPKAVRKPSKIKMKKKVR